MQKDSVDFKLKYLFVFILCCAMSASASEQPLLSGNDPSRGVELSIGVPAPNAASENMEAPAQESSPRGQPPTEQYTQAYDAETRHCHRARYAISIFLATALWVSTYGAYELSHKPHVCKDNAVDPVTGTILPGVNWRVWLKDCGGCSEQLSSAVYCGLAPQWTYSKKSLKDSLYGACLTPISICIEQANPSDNDQQECENNQITWEKFYKKAKACWKDDPLTHKQGTKKSHASHVKNSLTMAEMRKSLASNKVAKPTIQKPRKHHKKQTLNSGR